MKKRGWLLLLAIIVLAIGCILLVGGTAISQTDLGKIPLRSEQWQAFCKSAAYLLKSVGRITGN